MVSPGASSSHSLPFRLYQRTSSIPRGIVQDHNFHRPYTLERIHQGGQLTIFGELGME